MKFIEQKETFCGLPTSATLEALEELVKNSLVYLFNTKSYKIVT